MPPEQRQHEHAKDGEPEQDDARQRQRSEAERQGSVPLSSLNVKIDYGYAVARTTYGVIGVRVWINHGRYSDLVEA